MYHHNMRIHFVGCGNQHVSGLALLLHARGFTVSGCDPHMNNPILRQLDAHGCTIYHHDDTNHLNSADVVVYAPGMSGRHPKLQAARAANIPTIPSGQLLAEAIGHSYAIAVSGTHGKTMTAALIGHIMRENRWNPTVITPYLMRNGNQQFYNGASEWSVATARLSDGSLQSIRPTVAIVTNLAHQPAPDAHTTASEPFVHLLQSLPFYGTAVLCHDDTPARELRRYKPTQTLTYGLSAHSHVRGHIVHLNGDHSIFNISDKENGLLGSIRLPLPGSHNVTHALGAIAVCHYILSIPFEHIQKALGRFRGIARHFEYVGSYNKARVVDDCAAHPVQVDATLLATRGGNHQKLHVVFQPNSPAIIKKEWDAFIAVFVKHQSQISSIHIAPIDAESDNTEKSLNAEQFAADLSDATKKISLFCYQEIDEVADSLKSIVEPGDLILIMGAGSVAAVAPALTKK